MKTATAIQVEDPILLPLDDPALFEHPWIYIVEPGAIKFTDTETARLREFLLRGGTAMFDDFHGPYEWENFERQMKRVFPDRKIVEVPKDHPVFNAFYKIDGYPQVAGIGSFLAGRTWEKGGFVSHLRTILDDAGRPMVFINWNTDMGDGWEWSNVVEYPGLPEVHDDGVPDGHQRDRVFADTLRQAEGLHCDVRMTVATAKKSPKAAQQILAELRKVIVGQDEVVDEVLIALFTGGHCLIIGVPGLAKTLLIRTLADILDLDFKRIQFTPDLMPSDITGTEILDEDAGQAAAAFREGADLREHHSGGRNQPHAAEDAGRAARSDAGAARDRGRARRIRSTDRSSCWPRRTRSSRKARIRCPKRSSIASCSTSSSAT